MMVTKSKIVQISNALATIKTNNKVLTYAIIKNKKALATEVDALTEALQTDSDDYGKYVTAIRDVAQKYAAKKEDGTVIPTATGFRTEKEEDQEEVQTLINDINEEYADVIAERDKQIIAYNEMLTEEVEVQFSPLKLGDIPEKTDEDVLTILFDLIEE